MSQSAGPAPMEPTTVPPDKFKSFKDKGNYTLGWLLVICGLVDGAVDPFGGLTAPALLASGLALIGTDKLGEVAKKT
jgi:hypothetical protein